jgi:hypothetical protein
MRPPRPGSEAEMVALFLRTELPAARSRDNLQAMLKRTGLSERVVTEPDLDDDAENQARLAQDPQPSVPARCGRDDLK